MIRTGDVYTNPVTGERCVVRRGTERGGDALAVDLFVAPGGAVNGEHYHPALTERFSVVAGTLGVSVGGVRSEARAGDKTTVAPGTPHAWWNAGEDEAHVLVELTGSADRIARFEQMIVLMFGLAHEGRVDERGMPDRLQLAVIGTAFDDVIVFTEVPSRVQRFALPALALVARLSGRRASYPQHRALVIDAAR